MQATRAGLFALLFFASACTGRLDGTVIGSAMNNEGDSGVSDDAGLAFDAGVQEPDASFVPDASSPIDASSTPLDAGRDAGSSGVDAGRDAGSTTIDAGSSDCGTAIEQEELRLTNIARAAVGAAPLVCDPLLTEVARAHSRDMCEQDYFSHTALDGRSPFDRMEDAGVDYGYAGENIAAGQNTPEAVNRSWLDSPGHYANIINTNYNKIGIGHWPCATAEYDHYWTQNFTD